MNGRDFIRDLSLEERCTWGECATCSARDGECCRRAPDATDVGVHIGRLRAAPIRVRVMAIHSPLPRVTANRGDLWIPAAEIRP